MEQYMPVIFALGVIVLVIFVLREVACWWIKTTDLVNLLTEIRDQLRMLNGLEVKSHQAPQAKSPARQKAPSGHSQQPGPVQG